jgi:glutathione synthase/RimK-type ligase-like ATP-grasp enzyme
LARVALVTCAEIPLLEPDDRLVVEPLARHGITAEPGVWNDPAVDWSAYDLVVLRSTWDYAGRREEFVAWARSVKRLVNPVAVVAWNTDKRYLASLPGIPVVPTTFVGAGHEWAPPEGDYVIKPAIGAGSVDTGRYGPSSKEAAIVHMGRLQRDSRVAMVQPYLSAVDSYGETALLYFADPASGRLVFSHAIRKGPMLQGPDTGVEGLYKAEAISARVPTPEELAVSDRVVATLPIGLLYARVDLIPDASGDPVLLELELTEPSIFLEHSDGAAARFAASIAAFLTP